jgi:hypothetical protein
MKRAILMLLALALLLGGMGQARADFVTLHDTLDALVAPGSASHSYVNFGWLTVNYFDATPNQGLLQFDLSSIPSSSVVQSATLTLYHEYNDTGGVIFDLFSNTSSWNAGTVGAGVAPTYDGAPAFSVTPTGAGSFVPWDVTGIVGQWVSGAHVNDGLTLRRRDNPNPFDYFSAQHNDKNDPTFSPVLTVQFVTPAATAAPEPASLTLLGLGAAGLLGYGWRRRKPAQA